MSLNPLSGAGLDFGANLVNNAFSAKEARRSRAWQEEMSNTQYQRAAKDLEAAGLNRILAIGSPASAGSGSTASASNSSPGSTYNQSNSVRSVMEVNKEQAQLLRDQQTKTQAETDKVRAETTNLPLQGTLLSTQARGLEAQIPGWQMIPQEKQAQIQNLVAQLPKILADTRLANANAGEAEFKKMFYDKASPLLERLLDAIIPQTKNSAKGAPRPEATNDMVDNLINGVWSFFSSSPESIEYTKRARERMRRDLYKHHGGTAP